MTSPVDPPRRGFPAGALAALLYLVTVGVGGAIRPGYSHVSQAVSELTAAGAPHARALDAAFLGYNLLVGVAARDAWRGARSGWQRASAGSLALLAVSGVLMSTAFPMDATGTPPTAPGMVHLALAGVASLLSIGAMVADTAGRTRGTAGFAYGSASVAFVVVTGALAAVSAGSGLPWLGLAERATIGGFLQWLAASAWRSRE